MNKMITATALALFATVTVAQDQAPKLDPKYTMTPEESEAEDRAFAMRRWGGYVRKEGSAQGKVVFLNAQKAVPSSELGLVIRRIDKDIHPQMEIKDVDSVKLANPKEDIRKHGGKVGVVLVDAPDIPALLTAPEEGWSMVNVAPLKEGASSTQLVHRVRVEFLRAFALASGCAFMPRDPVVMRPGVLIPEDLDRIRKEEYGVDIQYTIEKRLPGYGVTPWKQTTYKQACKEGWAHSPTNDFQKKIWNKVRELPSDPIKIKRKKDK